MFHPRCCCNKKVNGRHFTCQCFLILQLIRVFVIELTLFFDEWNTFNREWVYIIFAYRKASPCFSLLLLPVSPLPLAASAPALIPHSHLLPTPCWEQGRVAELSRLWDTRSLIFRKWNLDSMSCCASGICICVCVHMCKRECVYTHMCVYLTFQRRIKAVTPVLFSGAK